MNDPQKIELQIDLRKITKGMQASLEKSNAFVAIGLNAANNITRESFNIPGLKVHYRYSPRGKIQVDDLKEEWNTWILLNGFRDVAELTGTLLDEVQKILSLWDIFLTEKDISKRRVSDLKQLLESRTTKFHKLGIPDKIQFLEKKYAFKLEGSIEDKILSVNSVRNCLTHRNGKVGQKDLNSDNALSLKWAALTFLVNHNGKQTVVEVPRDIPEEAELKFASIPKQKEFPLGSFINLSPRQFAEIGWTLLLFAKSCASRLEEYGKEKGFEFSSRI